MNLLLFFEYKDHSGDWKLDENHIIAPQAQHRACLACDQKPLFKKLVSDFGKEQDDRIVGDMSDFQYDTRLAIVHTISTEFSSFKQYTLLYLEEFDELVERHNIVLDDYLDGKKQKKKDTRRLLTKDIFDETAFKEVEWDVANLRLPDMREVQKYLHKLKKKKSYKCPEELLDYHAQIRIHALFGDLYGAF